MALELEMAYFKSRKEEWLSYYKGQLVLIKGEELAGTFTDHHEAFVAGVKRFGNVPFLIHPVLEEEEVAQMPALSVGVLSAHPTSSYVGRTKN